MYHTLCCFAFFLFAFLSSSQSEWSELLGFSIASPSSSNVRCELSLIFLLRIFLMEDTFDPSLRGVGCGFTSSAVWGRGLTSNRSSPGDLSVFGFIILCKNTNARTQTQDLQRAIPLTHNFIPEWPPQSWDPMINNIVI